MLSKISASGIGELLTGGKTAESYLLKKALENLGINEEFTTKAMEHGIINQYEAFELLLKEKFTWHDEYTPINDYCGAATDCKNETTVCDIKCNFYIDTFLEQVRKLPKKYYYQVQMQMIAEKVQEGIILLYLTSSEMDMYGNKIEYPYPLEDRHFIHEIKKDLESEERIMNAALNGNKILEHWIKILESCKVMERDEYFYNQMQGGETYRKLKTAASIENTIKKAFRVDNEFYYEVK